MAEEKSSKMIDVRLVSADELRVSYADNRTVVYTAEQLATITPKDVEIPDPE